MLKRSFITILFAIPLIALVLSGAFYFQYSQYRADAQARGGEEMSLLEYANYSFEILQEKSGGAGGDTRFDFAATLPVAPEGWSRTAYLPEHGEQITGVIDEPGSESVHTELEIQNDFRKVQTKQQSGAAASYINGGQIVALRISATDAPDPTTWEDQAEASPAGVDEDSNPVYLTVGDVTFTQLPQISRHFVKDLERPAKYRRFNAAIGDQLTVFAFSNAGDDAVWDVLTGLNYAALTKIADSLGSSVPDLTPDNAAPEAGPNEDDDVVTAAVDETPSLTSRISKLFSTKAAEEEQEPPRRMTCRMRKGAKHCFFPEEDE